MNDKGITLVELLITIVVMGIISAFSVVAISEIIDNTRQKAFVANGQTFMDVAKTAYISDAPIWDDDIVTLQELEDSGFVQNVDNDPWGRPYDKENTVITIEEVTVGGQFVGRITLDSSNLYAGKNVIFKGTFISQTATIGYENPMSEFTKDDIVYVNESNNIVERIIKTFDKNATEDITTDDNNDEVRIEKHLDKGASISTNGGDDLVHIGKDVKNQSTIDLGAGNDTFILEGTFKDDSQLRAGDGNDSITIEDVFRGSNLDLGEGEDDLTIDDDVRRDVIIDTGAGNDEVSIADVLYKSMILTASGNDTIVVGKVIRSDINMGVDNDVINVTNHVNKTTISLGDGNDTITIGDDLENESVLDTGDGNNLVTILDDLDKSSVQMGNGNDVLSIETVKRDSNISTGDGNDAVTIDFIATSFRGLIHLGPDDDSITIYNSRYNNNNTTIAGGSGYDVLYLPNMTYDEWQKKAHEAFTGFEEIVLLDKTITY
jgi:prepilin-type N-terminal cleavage/methylation domain-containing protein